MNIYKYDKNYLVKHENPQLLSEAAKAMPLAETYGPTSLLFRSFVAIVTSVLSLVSDFSKKSVFYTIPLLLQLQTATENCDFFRLPTSCFPLLSSVFCLPTSIFFHPSSNFLILHSLLDVPYFQNKRIKNKKYEIRNQKPNSVFLLRAFHFLLPTFVFRPPSSVLLTPPTSNISNKFRCKTGAVSGPREFSSP